VPVVVLWAAAACNRSGGRERHTLRKSCHNDRAAGFLAEQLWDEADWARDASAYAWDELPTRDQKGEPKGYLV